MKKATKTASLLLVIALVCAFLPMGSALASSPDIVWTPSIEGPLPIEGYIEGGVWEKVYTIVSTETITAQLELIVGYGVELYDENGLIGDIYWDGSFPFLMDAYTEYTMIVYDFGHVGDLYYSYLLSDIGS